VWLLAWRVMQKNASPSRCVVLPRRRARRPASMVALFADWVDDRGRRQPWVVSYHVMLTSQGGHRRRRASSSATPARASSLSASPDRRVDSVLRLRALRWAVANRGLPRSRLSGAGGWTWAFYERDAI